ncbi:MAG TPA: hypothetical protein VN653_07325 [Anaerolineales bacterium]|nr:hypothetical protein [Anaerolineales bacterium]
MNTKNLITRTVVTFAVLAIAGIGVAVSGRSIADVFDRSVMIAIGSAMFGAALAFFLVRMFRLIEK